MLCYVMLVPDGLARTTTTTMLPETTVLNPVVVRHRSIAVAATFPSLAHLLSSFARAPCIYAPAPLRSIYSAFPPAFLPAAS